MQGDDGFLMSLVMAASGAIIRDHDRRCWQDLRHITAEFFAGRLFNGRTRIGALLLKSARHGFKARIVFGLRTNLNQRVVKDW